MSARNKSTPNLGNELGERPVSEVAAEVLTSCKLPENEQICSRPVLHATAEEEG
jgi:hypothetical protein